MKKMCYCVTAFLLLLAMNCHAQVTCTPPEKAIPSLNNSKSDGTLSVGGCYNPIDGSYRFGGAAVGNGNLTKVITAYGTDGSSGFYPAATMTSGTKTVNFNSTWATSGLHSGATITVAGAGVAGADLVTTVATYSGGSTITTVDAASTTVSNRGVWWGQDDSTAFASAMAECATVNGCTIFVPTGAYVIGTAITAPSISSIKSGSITIQCLGGRQATRLIGATGNQNPIIQSAVSGSRPIRVLGCGFESYDPNVRPNIGVKITTGIEHLISDNYFGSVYNGVWACGSFINKIEFNRFFGNLSDSIHFENCNSSGMNYNIIRDNELGGTNGYAYYDLSGGDHNRIQDNDCEGTNLSGCFYSNGTYHIFSGNRNEVDNTGGNTAWRNYRFKCLQFSSANFNNMGAGPSARWAVEFEGDGSCSSNTNTFVGNMLANGTVGCINVAASLGGFTGQNWLGNVGDNPTCWGSADALSQAFYNNQSHTQTSQGFALQGYFGLIPANSATNLPQRKANVVMIPAPNGGGTTGISALNSGSAPVNRRQPSATSGAVYSPGDFILDTANGNSSGLDPHAGWVCVGNSNCTYNGSAWTGGTIMQVAASLCIIRDGTSAPASGTYSVCDRVINTSPSELGSAGSKYVVQGWICTAAGTPGTWLEQRTLTGN